MASSSLGVATPTTPIPAHDSLPKSLDDNAANGPTSTFDKASFVSPPPLSSSDMTPPPSSQVQVAQSPPSGRQTLHLADAFPASPPATVKQKNSSALIDTKILPNSEDIANAGMEDLRTIARGLVGALGESRMSTAHFKLQYNLLAMESEEAAKRADIEHQMTRREVEVLQSAEYRNRHSMNNTPVASVASQQAQIEAVMKRCRDLEDTNATLERRLHRAKRAIEDEKDHADLLFEENARLKKRIRENREHMSRLRGNGSTSLTPRNEFATPQRKPAPRFADSARSQVTSSVGSQDPFAALLAADQVLSGEPVSVPSTPTRSQPSKSRANHVRGAHSLSSLPTTPARSRPMTAGASFYTPQNRGDLEHRLAFSAPVSQAMPESAERHRHDRDSTISVSDAEEAITDEELPQSQASSLATNMLRRDPGPKDSPAAPTKTSAVLQTKLFGQVKKTGVDRSSNPLKRQASVGEADIAAKKAKIGGAVGLGIEVWESSGD